MIYGKLVRDRVPDIIRASGKQAEVITLNLDDYYIALKRKLLEEATEFSDNNLPDELVDIYEVLIALVAGCGIFWDEFEEMRLKKLDKGAFVEHQFLVRVTE